MAETPDTRRTELRQAAEQYLENCAEYTSPFEREKLINNWIEKDRVAQGVVDDFRKRVGDPKGSRMLDFGFGNAQFAIAFAQAGAQVDGLEVNQTLLDLAQENAATQGVNVNLRLYDGRIFPYADNAFDYAYSLAVFEHVSDFRLALSEVARVLKPGGKFYLAYPNRIALRETHTGIWFVNYLPRKLAHFLMQRFMHSNAIEELNLHFRSYFTLTRALPGIPLRIVPEYDGTTKVRWMFKRVLGVFGIHFSAVLTTVMVVLEKSAP